MKVQELFEDEPTAATAWIEKMYKKFPRNPMNNRQFVMLWGAGDDQELAMFELTPSHNKKHNSVEVKWFQAYPQRKGVGSKAMKALQALAREDNIILTLFPWEHGKISPRNLLKFYKSVGFKPISPGNKSLHWHPEDADK